MKSRFALLPVFAAIAVAASAHAQTFQYDARWYAGVRDNVLELQDRHRARIEALEARRRPKPEPVSVSTVVSPRPTAAPMATPNR